MAATPIVIVAYRNPADVATCLAAFRRAQARPSFEIFVCENGGADAYQELLAALTSDNGPCEHTDCEELLETPRLTARCVLTFGEEGSSPLVHVGQAAENFGYAGGVNAWLRPLMDVPGWPAVWVLNPDTQPAPDALRELAAYAEKWGKGMVGPRHVPMADPTRVHSRGLAWSKGRAVACSVDLHAPGDVEPERHDVEPRLDAPTGASMYVTRACIESVGLMDERYFLYFEDLEWGIRAKPQFGIGYAHRSVVLHSGGTTIGNSTHTGRQSSLAVYLEYRNAILFVRDRFPGWTGWTALVLLLRALRRLFMPPHANFSVALRGIVAGICGRSGRPDWLLRAHRVMQGKRCVANV